VLYLSALFGWVLQETLTPIFAASFAIFICQENLDVQNRTSFIFFPSNLAKFTANTGIGISQDILKIKNERKTNKKK
jgi:hypothetical protein